jgi:hypothetical protein
MAGLSKGGGFTLPKEEEVDWSQAMSPVDSGPTLVIQAPSSIVFTPSAVEMSDPVWQPLLPTYQPPVDETVEEKEGLKDWQKVAAGMAAAVLFLLLRGK